MSSEIKNEGSEFESIEESDLENVAGGWIRVQWTGPNPRRWLHNNVGRRYRNLVDASNGKRPSGRYY